MRRLLLGICVLIPLAVLRGPAPADESEPKASKPPHAYVVVFDFEAPGLGDAGAALTRSIFGKIQRQKPADLTLVDPITAAEATGRFKMGFESTPARVATVLAGELAANLAVLGTLARDGDRWTATVRLLDLRGNGDDWLWEKRFTAEGERARGLLADEITTAVTGVQVAKPIEAGRVPEPGRLGPTVNVNPDFEKGAAGGAPGPAGWGPIDNLTVFWVDDPGGRKQGSRGKIIRINSDVYEWQWKAWRKKLAGGATLADAPKRVATRGPKYDTVAGTYGLHVFNDYVVPKRGLRYRILADMKGKTTDFFFPKIFVKGYMKFTSPGEGKTQYREVWRTYLALRNFEGAWKHYSEVLTPSAKVEKLRVIIYAYWPPGLYEFDNVRLVEEPEAQAPTTQPATQPASAP